ncbi:hypothetical protein [Novosphingobium resinovorum]|uniref:hypothetical protein n=1 Tax=Novosphingobium resinovorum TaxID=158500 RepID=UPI001F1B8DD0|nr:hypothetical protein [Novosphingobium resinovorum]
MSIVVSSSMKLENSPAKTGLPETGFGAVFGAAVGVAAFGTGTAATVSFTSLATLMAGLAVATFAGTTGKTGFGFASATGAALILGFGAATFAAGAFEAGALIGAASATGTLAGAEATFAATGLGTSTFAGASTFTGAGTSGFATFGTTAATAGFETSAFGFSGTAASGALTWAAGLASTGLGVVTGAILLFGSSLSAICASSLI